MAVEMSDEDFWVVHDALFKVNHPFAEEEMVDVIKGERAAWKVVERVASEVRLALPADTDLSGLT